eukprot:1422952-Pyramimonas_sp.AAC.1
MLRRSPSMAWSIRIAPPEDCHLALSVTPAKQSQIYVRPTGLVLRGRTEEDYSVVHPMALLGVAFGPEAQQRCCRLWVQVRWKRSPGLHG